MVVLNSLRFCLSVKLLISSLNLNEILLGRVISFIVFFPFITVNMSSHSLLPSRVSVEKSADNFMGIPVYVICCFTLSAFNKFSLNLFFVSLINMCLGMFLLGFILYVTLSTSWTWVAISFPLLGNFSTIFSLNIFSDPFFFSSSSGTPIIRMLMLLVLSQRPLRLSSILFFILLLGSYFHHSIFQLTYLFFCLSHSAMIPSSVFFISVIVLFISVCLFFTSSRSLLNI